MTSIKAKTELISDYDRELSAIDHELDRLAARGAAIWQDAESATRLAFRSYHRASLTGSFDDLDKAEAVIREAIDRLGPAEDLCLLTAYVDLKTHRVHQVERDLALAPGLTERPESWGLLADADLQRGRYAAAGRGYESALDAEPSWDNMARVAHFVATFGELDKADDWYACAEDELTAKQMRSFSWIEVQRGLLDLERGRNDEARAHYENAAAAFSGSWLVAGHMAALCAAEGDLDVAIGLYREASRTQSRPELLHPLGDLLAGIGRADEASACYEKALGAFLDSARRGEVHYLHHLVDLCTDGLDDPEQAVMWAERDLALRPCWSVQAALARALFRSDRMVEAASTMRAAVGSGAVSVRLFADAASIYAAAGYLDEADALARRSTGINPHYNREHVHVHD